MADSEGKMKDVSQISISDLLENVSNWEPHETGGLEKTIKFKPIIHKILIDKDETPERRKEILQQASGELAFALMQMARAVLEGLDSLSETH